VAVDGIDVEQQRDSEPRLGSRDLLEPIHRLDDIVEPRVERSRPAEGRDRPDPVVDHLRLDVFEPLRRVEVTGPRPDELAGFLRDRHPVEEVLDPLRRRNRVVAIR